MRAVKTRFNPPYNSKGKTAFRDSAGKPGVYLIKKGKEIVYVGYSGSDLYKTMYRHFQEWNDPNQQRVVYSKSQLKRMKITVRVVYTNTAAQASRLEKSLIILHQPRDNKDKVARYLETPTKAATVGRYLDEYEEADFISVGQEPPF